MELAGRLDLLKSSDLDAFLDATLACLRLVQNILEHPHNERYRRLRGSAPILARPGVIDIMEAIGFRFEGTQLVLPDALLQTKDALQHLRHCKGEIIAIRRTTGCNIGWEVPQNSIHLACVQGTGVYGEVYSGTMDGLEVSVKLLQHMTVKKLRGQFSREIETLRQLRHSNVVELVGVVITVQPPSMVLESLSDSLLHELRNSSVTTGLAIRYLQQTAQGMHYIHSRGYLHCSLSAASLYLDAYGTVKIGDFSRARREGAAEEEDNHMCVLNKELVSDLSVRWMAPEVITDQKWSRASDVWSFGVVLYEFITSGSLPYAEFSNEQVAKMVATGYQLPCPPRCSDAFYHLVSQCCAPCPTKRPTFAAVVAECIPELEQALTQTPSSPSPISASGTFQLSSENSSDNCYEHRSLQRTSSKKLTRVKEPSLNSILNKGGDLIRVFTGMLSKSKPSVVVCCLPKTTAQDLVSMALFKCGKHLVVDSKNCRVVLVAAESLRKTQEQRACVVSAEQPIVAAKHDMGNSCQVVLYSSTALSSALPPSGQEVTAAVLKARQDPLMMPSFELHLHGYLILNEEVESDSGKRQVVCRWRKLWCVIHMGTMFLYNSRNDEEVRGYWRSLALNDCRLQVLYENKKKISGFSLHFPSGHDFMFSAEGNSGVEVCDWIEAINSGKHQGPSSFLKETSGDAVIHAGHLHFHQCLDVRKTKMTEIINKIHGHSQRETRAHSEDGVVEEGSSWVILRNNGMLEKAVLSEDPCEEGKYQPSTEEWINLSDVTSILFNKCETTSTRCTMEVYAPPSRFVLNAESISERCQWISCFRQILAKSGQESIISGDLGVAHSEGHTKRRAACTSAKVIFRNPSVDVPSTYYIRPDEVNCFSSDESLEDRDQKQRDSGASSTDSGVGSELHARESYSYLRLLPSTVSQDDSDKDLVSVCPDYDPIQHKGLVSDLPSLAQCEVSLCDGSDDESDLYCDIEDQKRRSTHIYDSITDFSTPVDLPFETIDETGKEEEDAVFEQREDSPLSSVPVQQEPRDLPLVLASATDSYSDGQDSQKMDCVEADLPQAMLHQYVDIASITERKESTTHDLVSGRSMETQHVDRLSDSSDLQCCDVEENVMSQKELSPSPETSLEEISPSPETSLKELSPSLETSLKELSPSPIQEDEASLRELSPSPTQDEASQKELSPSPIQEDEASLRELSPSPIQEDDYIPMKSAGLADDIQTFREEVATKPQVDWRNTSSLTPEQAQQQRQLSVAAIYAASPPPLPPRNYAKRTHSPLQQPETAQRAGRKLQRRPSNSSIDSLNSESSHLTRRGSFRNIRHLLGSLIHDPPPKGGPEKTGEAVDKRKMTVYKTAEILNLDGGIGLSGNHQYSSLRRKKKDEHVRTLGRSDTTSPPLLLTKKGFHGSSRLRPSLSNVFDTSCNLSDTTAIDSSSSVSCTEEDDEPTLPPRTSSCSGRVNSGSCTMPCFDPVEHKRSQSVRLHRTNTTGTQLSRNAISHAALLQRNKTEDGQQADVETGVTNMADRNYDAETLTTSYIPGSTDAISSEQLKQPDEVDNGRSDCLPADKGLEQKEVLPPGWEKALDSERGIHYYFNPRTSDITWNLEEVFQLAKQCQLPPGEGWQAVDLSDGCRYFYHSVSQKTTWRITDTWADGAEGSVAGGVV